jgi:hypothetical protein
LKEQPKHIREAQEALMLEDVAEVERLLLCHANAGEIDCEELLGVALMLFAPERREDAIRFLQHASNAGSGLAAHNLGTLYGLSSPDRDKALACYQRASDLGFEQKVSSDPLWWRRA